MSMERSMPGTARSRSQLARYAVVAEAKRRFVALAIAMATSLASIGAVADDGQITLHLKWRHQFQFAGYYVALESGLYEQAGLDVRIVEATPERDALSAVLAGEADFGVGTSELLLARSRGDPVVVLGVVMQHSPLILLARADTTRHLHSLGGLRVMIEPGSAELLAYLRAEGLDPSAMALLPHTLTPEPLIEGEVQAMSAYSTTEPFLVAEAGVAFHAFTPRSGGIDFYGDNLFTTESTIRQRPDTVRAFREASFRGWQLAMEDIEGTIDLILERYNSQGLSREFLRFEADEMRELMRPDLIEVGYMHHGRWTHIAQTYQSMDMLDPEADWQGLLYAADDEIDLAWLYRGLALFMMVMIAAAGVILMQVRLNRRLAIEVAERRAAEDALRHANDRLTRQLDEIHVLQVTLREEAIRDPLTGLFNRRYLDEALEARIAEADRARSTLALILIDIDAFKAINDTHGHAVGDEVLRDLATLLAGSLRRGDVASRHGGEEFVVLMPATPLVAAVERAERWREAFAARRVAAGDTDIACTLSAGVAVFPMHAHDARALLAHADLALYQAKNRGRNQVRVYQGDEVPVEPVDP